MRGVACMSNDRAKSARRRVPGKTSKPNRLETDFEPIDDESRFLADQQSQLSQRGQQTNRTNTHGHWTPRRGGTRRSLLRPVITIHSSPVRSYCWPPHTRHYGHDTLRICNLRLNREYRSCSSICIQ